MKPGETSNDIPRSMLDSFCNIKHAIYINLDSRPDRRVSFETHFNELKIAYPTEYRFIKDIQRFPAIKNNVNGAIGCSQSHANCIRLAKNNGWDHVLIMEDDVIVNHPEILFHQVNQFLKQFKDNWDVLLLSGNNYPPFKIESPACYRVANCQTTGCYIVRKHYYDTLIRNFEEGVNLLITNPNEKSKYACDVFWKKLQRLDMWYLITPICVTQRPDYSDIEERFVNYDSLMLNLNKHPAPTPKK